MRGLIVFLLFWTAAGRLNAQTAASATWALTANQNATVTGNITATAQQLSGLSVQDYISGGQRSLPPGNNWPAQTMPDSTRFMQFVLSPTNGNDLNVKSVALMISFYGSGAGRVNLAWSTDSVHFTNLTSNFSLLSGTTPIAYTFGGQNITVPSGKKMYFRISPWTASAISSKYLLIKNLVITGTTNVSPVAGWTLTANQTATVTGQVSATAQALSGLKLNNYISGNGGQRILPLDGNWPANTGPDSNRYVQYTVTPTVGYNFVVNQVKIPLSFNSSASAHARICWSTDGITFTDLNSDVALASGSIPSLVTFANLNIPVSDNRTFFLRVYPWTTSAFSDGRYLVSKDVSLNGFTEVWSQLAFPGAEGGGRYAKGGRGGEVYYVTNLKDSLAGSLRDAVSQPNRTVIFKVSGTINLRSVISITKDNITIAGQTAPGNGICLKNYGLGIRANNIIVRHIRSRPGDVITVPGDSSKVVDAMYNNYGEPITQPFKNIIVDHCSMSWSTDEVGSFYAISNFTLQWSMLSESLYQSIHTKGTPHGYGGIWGGQNASFHHNLLASNSNRNPRFSGSTTSLQPELEYADFRNNVVYNWVGSPYGGAGGHYNMVNNYHKAGPATTGAASSSASNRKNRILLYTSYSTTLAGDTVFGGKFYLNGNYVHGFPDVTADNWTKGVQLDGYYNAAAMKAAGKALIPFPYAPVVTQTAEDAFDAVMNGAGAILPRRDTVDRRIIKETLTGTATYEDASYVASGMLHPSGIIDSQTTVGGWPVLASTDYPMDTDNDGLPNWWEKMIQNSATDSTGVDKNTYGTDGYTMLEKYLNGIPSPDQQVSYLGIDAQKGGLDTVKINFNIDWAKDQFSLGLYRSTDGSTFTKISAVTASINQTAYLMKDNAAPQQLVYYKIGSKHLDDTGDIVYSNTVSIDNNPLLLARSLSVAKMSDTTTGIKENRKLKMYPNPVSGILTVKHAKINPSAVINVYNIMGERVMTRAPQMGMEQTEIDVTHLPPGSYIIEFNNSSARQNGMFVKM
ncbi:Por secretion system C-terminal sorting domain-containing protein [Pedobacter sp. ok626]|nr:Por secretion system C-terminal sorting domain-containing protein [Pedobacter sp. ok626]